MRKVHNISFKALSLLIAFSVLLSTMMIGFTFTAKSDTSGSNIWSGNIATAFADGNGTSEKPYLIENGEQLALMLNGTVTSGRYFKLSNDIYLNDVSNANWKTQSPKSWYNRTNLNNVNFEGNFNGNGFTVYGLYFNGINYAALFPCASNATITDVTISKSSITSSWVASGIVALGSNTITVNRCIVDETVDIKCTDTSNPNDAIAAGFVGYGSPAISIDNSAVMANITSDNNKNGAFIGNCWGTVTRKITNSFSAVNAPMTGHKNNSITVDKCYNIGTENFSYTGTVNKLSSADLMKGTAAKQNMPSLNWKTWKTTTGYPKIKIFDPNGTKGEVWSGGIAEKYAGGTGNEGDPYLIETPEQLARMVGYDVLTNYSANITNGSTNKYYKLTADIYLNDVSNANWYQADGLNKWYSSDVSRFCGSFDGNGYTIYGLYTDSNAKYGGLFSVADAWSKDRYFKDITISNSYLVTSHNTAFVGAIAGRIYSGNNKTTYFNNCYVTDSVIFSQSSSSEYWGGLVGYAHPTNSSFFSLTACAVLSKTPTDCAFTGGESPSGTLTVTNSFSVNSKWVKGNGASATDSYLSVDKQAIKGNDAKDTMPNLAWEYIWQTDDKGYPTYFSRNYDLNGTVGGVWSGLTAIDYAGGSGIETDPYKIATAEQFIKMLKDSNSFDSVNNRPTYYELISNINFNDTSSASWKENARKWIASSNRFKGVFDGKGHTIKGIYFDGTNNNIGLFGIAEKAVIKNFIMDDSYIKSSGYGIGGVVGQVIGTVELNECYLGENVYVVSTYSGNDAGAGGLIGYGAATVEINGCAFLGTVKAEKFAGAILGNCWAKDQNGSSRLTVKNTFSNSEVPFCSKQPLGSDSDNNYSVCEEEQYAVIPMAADKLMGEEAMETMSGLDWGRLWQTTENGYPVCQFTDDAGSPAGIWSGNIAEDYASGTGSKANPYIIETGEQLALMVVDIENSGKYYKLGADIKLNDTSATKWRYVARQWIWTSNIFKGNLDGDGHKITGLYYNGTKSKVGLFAYAADATVSNLAIDESFLHSTGFGVGTVIGDANGGTVILNECYIGEKVHVASSYNKGSDVGAGGLIGYGGAAITVNGSAFLGKVKAPSNAGSLLGNCWAKDENGSSNLLVMHSYSSLDMRLCSKQDLNYKSDNNYSAFEDGEGCVAFIESEKMAGADAQTNMPKLDWGRYWKTGDNYPVCRFGDVIDTPEGVWSGNIADSYAGGSGMEDDPYLIANGEQLALMVRDTDSADKYYKLTADIKLNVTLDDWTLTAKQWNWTDNIFGGNFDGDGHKITGLYYDGLKSKVGLFSYAANATISNLIVDNAYIHSIGYAVGAIIGDANSGTVEFNECYVGENVYVESTFDADSNGGAGGLIGYGGAAITVNASAFLGKVKAPENVGAILGNCWGKDSATGSSALIVNNTFSNLEVPFCSKQPLSSYSDNNYSASDKKQIGVIFIRASEMTGKDAIKNMSSLDWSRHWKVNESGYPICRFGDILISEIAWKGEVADNYESGTGTKEDPYIIMNGGQLAKMVLDSESDGKYYKLGADIYLNDTTSKDWKDTAKQWIWTNNVFKGTFDGDTKVIRGLYYNGTKSKIGLFCYVADAVIRRVVLDDAYICSLGYATGSLIGDANTGTVLVEECYATENVYVESKYNADTNVGAGGLIGYGGAAITINGSAFLGEVKAPANVGAILGNCWTAAVIKNSFATPSVKFCSKRAISGDSADNYGTGTESENGVHLIAVEDMKGEIARTNMENLNWFRSWKTTANSFPVLNVGEFEGIEGEVWSGRLATSFAGGNGTEDDPYLIATPEQLALLLDNVVESKGKHYKLTADIYLNDVSKNNWYESSDARPWFYVSTARLGNFNGHFDGDGHVIYGLYLRKKLNSSVLYTGLFPTISDGTVIEKTGLSNAYIKITSDNIEYQSYVGGIAGNNFFNQPDEETDPNNLAVISQCFGDSKVILEGRYVGGLVGGGPRPLNINNSYFIGEVIGERVAAIFGNTWTDYEGGEITANYAATNAADIFCGGKAGVQNSATPINYHDNYTNATGSVSGHSTQISLLMMRGNSAKKNMPALDFKNIWHALENGTPVLKIFGTTDKFSNTSDPEPIEISFVSNGGTPCENIYGHPEEKLTLPVPTKEGYEFAGWYVYRELDIEFSIDYFPYFDQILYAKWVPLGIIQDFENYPNSMYDLGWDYEYYRPGTVGYDARYVHGGMASMHRIGLDDYHSDVLMNYEEMLTIGKKYNVTFFVTTDTQDTSVKLSLVHEKWPDVYAADFGVETMKELDAMNQGTWQKVEYTFIARTKWIAIRTSGGASIYIDDFMAVADSDKIYPIGDLPVEETPEENQGENDSNSSDENASSEAPSQSTDSSGENTSSEITDNSQENTSSDNSGDNVSSETPSMPSNDLLVNDNPIVDNLPLDNPIFDDTTSQEGFENNEQQIVEPEDEESKKVVKKRIWKKRKPRKKNNNMVWIITGISVSAVVLIAATILTIIFVKKRKGKKK